MDLGRVRTWGPVPIVGLRGWVGHQDGYWGSCWPWPSRQAKCPALTASTCPDRRPGRGHAGGAGHAHQRPAAPSGVQLLRAMAHPSGWPEGLVGAPPDPRHAQGTGRQAAYSDLGVALLGIHLYARPRRPRRSGSRPGPRLLVPVGHDHSGVPRIRPCPGRGRHRIWGPWRGRPTGHGRGSVLPDWRGLPPGRQGHRSPPPSMR